MTIQNTWFRWKFMTIYFSYDFITQYNTRIASNHSLILNEKHGNNINCNQFLKWITLLSLRNKISLCTTLVNFLKPGIQDCSFMPLTLTLRTFCKTLLLFFKGYFVFVLWLRQWILHLEGISVSIMMTRFSISCCILLLID